MFKIVFVMGTPYLTYFMIYQNQRYFHFEEMNVHRDIIKRRGEHKLPLLVINFKSNISHKRWKINLKDMVWQCGILVSWHFAAHMLQYQYFLGGPCIAMFFAWPDIPLWWKSSGIGKPWSQWGTPLPHKWWRILS